MTLSLHFSDSEVASVTSGTEGVVVRFSAAHVERAPSAPSEKPAVGFSRGVSLILSGATHPNELSSLVGRISNGRVAISGKWSSAIALPLAHEGQVSLELTFSNQSQLSLAAQGVGCQFNGDANFAESLFC